MLVPDVFRDIGPADDVAGTARQVFEQRVFLRGQRNFRSAHVRTTAPGVDDERAGDQPIGKHRLAATADHRTEPGQQLAEVVWFDEVIVGAAIEPFDP